MNARPSRRHGGGITFYFNSLVCGPGHEMVVGGAHGDRDHLVRVAGEEPEESVVVQRQVSDGVIHPVSIRAHQHSLDSNKIGDRLQKVI